MQPNINKKPEWIKTTPHTPFTVLPHNFECVDAPAGKRFDAHLILTAIAVSTGEFSIKEVFFVGFFSLCRKRCGFDAAA